MRPDDPNLPDLLVVAAALGDLVDQLVFVGGSTAGLLITDPAADPVRPTRDVDAIVEARLAKFHLIEEQVATRGFVRDIDSDVVCRWIHRDSKVQFDLMPIDPNVLGFSNRWYSFAVETAQPIELIPGLTIRVVSAVAFVATKLEAFADRGNNDMLASHDLEDVLNVVDGRPELADELAASPIAIQSAIGRAFSDLLGQRGFDNALPGLIPDSGRAQIVKRRLKVMAK